MEAELRSLYSTDIHDLRTYAPGEVFCLLVRAMIGPKGLPGEESFDILVCSPAWLEAEVERVASMPGRFHLFMKNFDYDLVEKFFRQRIAEATDETWSAIARKLARWSMWEFEDYE